MENVINLANSIVPLFVGVVLVAAILLFRKCRNYPTLVVSMSFIAGLLAMYSYLMLNIAVPWSNTLTWLIAASAVMITLTAAKKSKIPFISPLVIAILISVLTTRSVLNGDLGIDHTWFAVDEFSITFVTALCVFIAVFSVVIAILILIMLYLGDATIRGNRIRYIVYPFIFLISSILEMVLIMNR